MGRPRLLRGSLNVKAKPGGDHWFSASMAVINGTRVPYSYRTNDLEPYNEGDMYLGKGVVFGCGWVNIGPDNGVEQHFWEKKDYHHVRDVNDMTNTGKWKNNTYFTS